MIDSWEDVSVYSRDGQETLLVQGIVDKARRQLFMFRVLLTIIAGIIMALIIYTLTLDKIYSIALLKLIGASNYVILGMILQQALLLGVLGYGIAYLAGSRLFPAFPRRVVFDRRRSFPVGDRGRGHFGPFQPARHLESDEGATEHRLEWMSRMTQIQQKPSDHAFDPVRPTVN